MPKPFQSTARTESWNGLLLQMGGSKLMLMRQSMSQNKKQGWEQLLEIAEAKLLLQQSRESHIKKM
ncbi:hypothetical protein CUMW_146170 [Citrus unshiu]|nr:hypothetical protein CUMW_146170 [Citrus unshiu]